MKKNKIDRSHCLLLSNTMSKVFVVLAVFVVFLFVSIRPGTTECSLAVTGPHLCFNPLSVVRDPDVDTVHPLENLNRGKEIHEPCATITPACRTNETVLGPALVSQRTSGVSLSFCC